jgi:hypothetical protein
VSDDIDVRSIIEDSNMNQRTSVAAHVQADTIPDAINPGFTLREALVNSSELFGENAVYLA